MAHTQATIKPLMGRAVVKKDGIKIDLLPQSRLTIGRYIRDARLKAGLTQREVGEAIGTNNKAVNSQEVGRQNLAPEYWERIPEAFGWSKEEREAWGWFLLENTNPWLFRLLRTARGKPKLQQALNLVPPRRRRSTRDSEH